jgi:Ner family transcriptional regulator
MRKEAALTKSIGPVPSSPDWHPADVIAALRKAGWTLRGLDTANGYGPGTIKHALTRPYPKAEQIIAKALRMRPRDIWPSRYPQSHRRAA